MKQVQRTSRSANKNTSCDVVICIHNALDDVKNCLESIYKNTYTEFNLILVNDCSDEPTTNYLKTFSNNHSNIKLIENIEPKGYTKSANLGLRASKSDYVVLMNSDVIVPESWLNRIIESAETNETIGLVGPLSNAASWQSVPERFNTQGEWAINELPSNITITDLDKVVQKISDKNFPEVPILNGFCILIKKEVIHKIGYLDEAAFPYGYGEENDFCFRAIDAGYKIIVNDSVYIYHAKSKSFGTKTRNELSKAGTEALLNKHGKEKLDYAVSLLKNNIYLNVIRNKVAGHLKEIRLKSIESSDNKINILFLLPITGTSGGIHSIVQEVYGMRELGINAKIATWQKFQKTYFAAYSSFENKEDLFYFFSDYNELVKYSSNFDVVTATIFNSIILLKKICNLHPNILPAYYVQDYEPFFFEKDSEEYKIAFDSYTLIPGILLFAKTNWLCDVISEIHKVKVEKVSPSLDTNVYYPIIENFKKEDRINIIAMVRPSTPRRGAERTMRVLKRVKDKNKDKVDIKIFGSTNDLLKEYELETNFEFENLGILKREEVATQLRRSDIFLDLSVYQAFGRTGLEAMACGCAVVLPKRGGINEYAVFMENSILVDTRNDDECFSAVDLLVNDNELRKRIKTNGIIKSSEFSIRKAVLSEVLLFKKYIENKNNIESGDLNVKVNLEIDGFLSQGDKIRYDVFSILLFTNKDNQFDEDYLKKLENSVKSSDEIVILDFGLNESEKTKFLNYIQNKASYRFLSVNDKSFSEAIDLAFDSVANPYLITLKYGLEFSSNWSKKILRYFTNKWISAVSPIISSEIINNDFLQKIISKYQNLEEINKELEKQFNSEYARISLINFDCSAFKKTSLNKIGKNDCKISQKVSELDLSWKLMSKGFIIVASLDTLIKNNITESFEDKQSELKVVLSRIEKVYGIGKMPLPENIWGINLPEVGGIIFDYNAKFEDFRNSTENKNGNQIDLSIQLETSLQNERNNISPSPFHGKGDYLDKSVFTKINFAIKIGVPDRSYENWGDIFFAEALSKAFKKAGHNCVIHYLNEWNQEDKNIDVVIHLKGLSKYKIKKHNVNILWIINHPELHDIDEINSYDLVFAASKPYYENNQDQIYVPFYYLPQATDLQLFRPIPTSKKEFDILFVGNNYEVKNNKCRKIIEDILSLDNNYNLQIVGKYWENFVESKYILSEFIENNKLSELYNKSKIVLNDHQKTMRLNGFINNRTYDIAATKSFQISDYVEGIEDIGITSYKGKEELEHIINFYINNDTERNKKAEEDYNSIKEQTFENRAKEILNHLISLNLIKKEILPNKSYGDAEPIVCILMPSFNRQDTVADAIQSVVDQTFKDWNLIIVNDGGDDIDDVICSFNDPRIKYHNLTHAGKPAALNFAINHSKSKYIAYLDDDDKFHPNHLEVMVSFLETHPESEFIYSMAEEVLYEFIENSWIEKQRNIRYAQQVTPYHLRFMNHIPNLCAVHKRSLFEKAGMYDESLTVLIDWDMYRRLALASPPKFINVLTSEYGKRIYNTNNTEKQITGIYKKDPLKYYNNRLRILAKKYSLEHTQVNCSDCLVIYIDKANLNDLKYFVYKIEKFRKGFKFDLTLIINSELSINLVEGIQAGESVGALAIWNEKGLSTNHFLKEFIEQNKYGRFLLFDDLESFNINTIRQGFTSNNRVHNYAASLKKVFKLEKVSDVIESNYKGLTVSVIIPTYNNWALTNNCLKSLLVDNKNQTKYEVIIVDNASIDKTREELKIYQKKYKNLKVILNEKNLGFAAANNKGASISNSGFLLFLNNDTVTSGNWLDEMIKAYLSDNTGVVGAKLLYPDTHLIQHAGVCINDEPHQIFPFHIYHNQPSDYAPANMVRDYQVVTGACLLINKKLFNDVNGFDEEFINGYEDVDLCFKVQEKGYKIKYTPKAEVLHYCSQTPGRFDNVEHNIQLLHSKWLNKIRKDNIDELLKPKVSIIIPVFNQLDYTKQCLKSVVDKTAIPYEIIIINNASTDGSKEYIDSLDYLVVINNDENLGYPKACNQGLRIAKGEYIVLLNNDTIVTKNWLENLIETAESDKSIGMVGPVSNLISGLQLDVEANYKDLVSIEKYSQSIYSKRRHAWMKTPRIAFVCALIKKELIDKLGGLDERFSPGNFEDDDYCLRASLAGYKIYIAFDTFVHHFGSISFKKNGNKEYDERISNSRQKFVDKWGADPEEIWIKGKPIKSFEIFIPLNNNEFPFYFEKALNEVEKNKYEDAIISLQQAIKFYHKSEKRNYDKIEFSDVLNLAGNVSLYLNDFEKAQQYFEQELQQTPNSSRACKGLGDVFYSAEMFNEAKTMYELAVQINPGDSNLSANLEKVKDILNHQGKEIPTTIINIEKLLVEAEDLIKHENFEKAEELLDNILQVDVNNLDALNDFAIIKIMKEKFGDALDILEKVLSLDPENEIAKDNLQYLQEKINEISEKR